MFSKLKTLEITNFRSYKYLLLEDIDKLGLTLISGNNGSGKSTIKNAIEYLLTDTTSESISLDEFSFNNNGNCILRCVLDTTIGIIEITKHRDHSKFGNSTILSVNGNSDSYTETDRRETQKNIFNILGITKEILPISSIFSQHSQSFPNSKETDRKKIIYDAENLHKYTAFSDIAGSKEKELNKLLEESKNKFYIIEQDLEQLNKSLEQNEFNSITFEENRNLEIKLLKVDRDKRKNEYTLQQSKNIKDLEEERIDLNKKLSDLRLRQEETQDKIDRIKKELLVSPSISILKKEKDEFFKFKNKLTVEKLETEKYINKINTDTCPILHITCDSLITKRDEITNELSPKIKELNKKLDDVDKNIKEKDDNINKVEVLDAELSRLVYTDDSIRMHLELAEEDITNIDDKIGCSIEDDGKGLEEVLSLIDKRIEDAKIKANPFRSSIEDTKNLIEDKQDRVAKLSSNIKQYEEGIKYYNFWKVGYGKAGIPNMKAEDFLNALELETNKTLSLISDRMFVNIGGQTLLKDGKTVSEKISYKVFHPDKLISDFFSYSGGERQRIIISDIFAFNKLLSKLNFIVLDEILELSLDSIGKENILNLLKRLDLQTVFVISHDNSIKDSFDNIIKVEKIDGESCIKMI